ncbi:MAG: NADH-quinone oxidoreductase subunit C [Thermodesulfovibrionales bacterium]
MEPLQVAEKLKEQFPSEVAAVEEFRGQVSVSVAKGRIVEICRFLRDEPELGFDLLRDLCGVDYLGRKTPRFEVVYHLYSIRNRRILRLKAQVPEDDARIQSVVPVWIGADWHERECYDMYGIVFEGHPDLRRILMPEDWEGHPLRKDYPLRGPSPENDWRGFKEVLDKAERFKKYEWNG